MSIPWLWLHNTSWTSRSIFSWQLHQTLWPHMKPARPMNAPSPSPPGQRNCGFSSNPMKGTVPEASRFPMWHTMVSRSHDAQDAGLCGCALNWRNWLPSQLEDAGKHMHSASQAGRGKRTWLTHWGHILNRHLGTLIMGMKKNGLENTGKVEPGARTWLLGSGSWLSLPGLVLVTYYLLSLIFLISSGEWT